KLERVASEMKSAHAGKALRIEGHCDERGTEEYNRSLGERRAQSVREYLVRLGMNPTMIQTISMGEERPAVSGHDEAAWSKNRRGELVLLTPAGGTAQGGTQ
ncbi:MAG TPA: OmpA family protein, partial [Candidatus Binatia bacterium]